MVCRKCFVKTIQVAVTQRCLPLRCVVCRTRILKLKQDSSAEAPLDNSSSKKTSFRQLFSSSKSGDQGKESPTKSATQTKPVATKLMQPLLIYPSDNGPKRQQAFVQANTAAPPAQHHNLKEPAAPILKNPQHQFATIDRFHTTEHLRTLSPSKTALRTRSRSASRARSHSKHVTFADPPDHGNEKRIHAGHVCCVAQDSAASLLSPRVTRCPRNGHADLTRGTNLSPLVTQR